MNHPQPKSHESPATGLTQRRAWFLVGLLMALCFVSHLNRLSMAVAGDARLIKSGQFSPEKMGTIYTAFLVAYTLAMIPGGLFLDRFGSRLGLAVVGVGSALFVGATGLAGSLLVSNPLWAALLGVRATMGLVSSPLHPGCARAVGEWIPTRHQAVANGLLTSAAIFGVSFSHKIFGALIDAIEWPRAFMLMGGITLGWGILWLGSTRNLKSSMTPTPAAASNAMPAPDDSSPKHHSWRTTLRQPSVLLLTLSYAAMGYFQYLFFYWMHYYFEEVLKLGKEQSATLSAIPPMAMAGGMFVGGFITDHISRRQGEIRGRAWVATWAMFGAALLLLGGVVSRSPGWMVAWFSLALAVAGACEAAYWSTAVSLGRAQGGTVAAIVNTGGNAGGLLAPLLTPWIARQFHWQAAIAVGAVVCLLGAFCWRAILQRAASIQDDRTSNYRKIPT